MSIKDVTFYSNGFKLSGTLHIPEEIVTPKPAVILCYGFADFKDAPWAYAFCDRLKDIGLISLRFDYRCSGLSEGKRGRLICSEQVEDIRNAITFLQTLPFVRQDSIGLIGWSLGGAHVVQVSAIDKRVKFAVSVAGIGDGERWLHWCFREYKGEEGWSKLLKLIDEDQKRRVVTGESIFLDSHTEIVPSPPKIIEHVRLAREKFPPPRGPVAQVSIETAESIINYKPEDFVSLISCPMLLVHGEKDDLVPWTESLSMFSKAKCPKKLIILPDADHLLLADPNEKIFNETVELILNWIKSIILV